MAADRFLIVNADDFGLSSGVTRGIIRAHQEGVLTSTSLMVRGAAASEAAELARSNPRLSIGLHVDLAEWIFRNGEWQLKYQVASAEDPVAVAGEVARQLDAFHRLLGKTPTHIDSHQHLHRNEPVRSILIGIASKLKVPLRDNSDRVRFCGDFYGQTGEGEPYPEGISLENAIRIVSELQPGWTEMSCHPGDDDALDSVYRAERKRELEVLCAPRLRERIGALRIQLRSFADLIQEHQPEVAR